jgi:hypothetical protein
MIALAASFSFPSHQVIHFISNTYFLTYKIKTPPPSIVRRSTSPPVGLTITSSPRH